ncbi:hypothetical protein VPHG_00103 [Vibrio phage 11895-B1]|uniref:hypothetical protein n=1 Tax=Vibrio phage 11895-B1 TaxID=754075 RepID=UPI0002C128A3|nr:hypothetical protein VPHG_00103 [Vibrio phage 11895-B1]AGH32170.1 hypothetical protein VPHG_00103 [Vibrio phage 11895-B1]
MLKQIEDFPNYYIDINGDIYNKDKLKLSKQVSKQGYNVIKLYKDGKYYYRRCARLVGFVFLKESYEDGMVINHKDLNKLNDNVLNLEWVSSGKNYEHSFNLQPENHKGNRQYSEDTIHKLCVMLEEGHTRKNIANVLNIPIHVVKRVKNKVYWQWISDKYDFNSKGRGLSLNTMIWVKHRIAEGWSNDRIMANKKSVVLTDEFLNKVRNDIYWKDLG